MLGGAGGVGGANGVAVHRGVVERRDIEGGDDVLGDDLAESVKQRLPFDGQAIEEGEDALAGILDGDHGTGKGHASV